MAQSALDAAPDEGGIKAAKDYISLGVSPDQGML